MDLSDSHHFHKTVAGVCMVVGPLCALGAFVVSPPLKSGTVAQVAQVAQHQDRFLISTLLALAAVLLTTGAAMGLMHMLRERMTGLGNTGGLLALVGLLATMAQVGIQFALWPMVINGVQPADVATWDAITSETAVVIPLFIVPWVAVVGFALLGVGLYRAHAVHGWMAAMVPLGALGITLAGPAASLAVGIVGAALFLVGLGAIGLMVLRETDADWEHTPEYHGFRPAAGIG
jgi:hypothetical protein